MKWTMYEFYDWKETKRRTVTPYGIIISHETFKFFRYKPKPLRECVYLEDTGVTEII